HLEHGVRVAGGEEAVWSPDPVGDRCVNEDRPSADEPEHRGELHALSKRTCDQRRRDDREGELEAEVDRLWDRGGKRVGIADAFRDIAENPLQERSTEPSEVR